MRIISTKEPVQETDLQEVEKKLGLKLPSIYRCFLLKHNGGEPTPDGLQLSIFDLREEHERDPNDFITIDDFYDTNRLLEAWGYTRIIFEGDTLLPIADVAGSMLICVGFGQRNADQIVYWHMDFGFVYITDSIDNFLNLLVP
jgi:hypothetical protein